MNLHAVILKNTLYIISRLPYAEKHYIYSCHIYDKENAFELMYALVARKQLKVKCRQSRQPYVLAAYKQTAHRSILEQVELGMASPRQFQDSSIEVTIRG